jgi:dihydrofolate synthase/folylpolyglutamate synthase
LRPGLAGRHQLQNTIVAIRAAECLGLDAKSIEDGVRNASWPGRLERFEGNPAFLLDGAHNAHAAKALAAFLREFYPEGVWMIFGVMEDKNFGEMLTILSGCVKKWIFTRPAIPRAKDPHSLALMVFDSVVKDSVGNAIQFVRDRAPYGTTVVVCGSLYLIGEARAMLQ